MPETVITPSKWASPPEPVKVAPPEMDATAMSLAATLDSLIALGAATSPRGLQVELGPSDAGQPCDRRLAYKLHGTSKTNFRDPLRALVGVGGHLALADVFRRLNAGTGRWLVEHPIRYGELAGTVDLYDRHILTVIDWKWSTKDKIRRVRAEGPPLSYKVQLQIYGAALLEAGEKPSKVALIYLPTDGELSDLWVWVAPLDTNVARDAVTRIERLHHVAPQSATPKPDRLCPWCDHYRPGSTDLRLGCPGQTEGKH